jgi:hypothetical protein
MPRQRHHFLTSKLMLVDLPASIWGGMSKEIPIPTHLMPADSLPIYSFLYWDILAVG